ncbi:MAG TPA: hypothetical protein VF158_05100 [Longimicrobiales bacterium]
MIDADPSQRGGTLREVRSEEHHIRVARTARFHTLGDPRGPIRQVWFVCHGYGQLAGRFIRRFEPIAGGGRLIVAPEALNRFYTDDEPGPHGPQSRVGATWMTREDRLAEIADYVAYLDALYSRIFETVDRDAVEAYALGFSQGAATVCRWIALGTARMDRMILWASFLPVDLDLAAAAPRLRAVRPVLVAGESDAYATPDMAEHDAARLREWDIDAAVITFPGGHALDAAILGRIARGEV